MAGPTDSPPRAPPVQYATPLGTRWEKEKAAAGSSAFEYPDDAKYVGPWIIGECVGKGASGRVKIARHRRTGQLAAVKILPLQPFLSSRSTSNTNAKAEKQRLGIDREIIMMKLMNHPNIMRIYDVYEGEKELYLILEYVEGGELFDFLVNRGRLPPLEALAYFKQIVYGLNYAHTFSIIHRDLKPENILIHSLNPPLIKIADWGMAAFAPPTLQLETSCGSPHYASPEIVNGHKYCGTATDIWSCGVILYALLTGRLPFDDKNVRTLLTKVKTGKYDMPSFVDPLAKNLLSRMLVVDVNQRITMAEILAHPWLEGSTPGITYVPSPSVSELAQPLPSALHIDRDLFESLCVIWGRHADVDCIQADLLSPAGQGTLAKAFYFLLQKHREMTMREHGILMDIDEILNSTGKIVTKQYAAPRSKIGRRSLDLTHSFCAVNPQYLRSARAFTPASRTPSPQPPVLNMAIPMERAPSRPHPPSPAGPRPQKPKPQGNRSSVILSAPPAFVPNPDLSLTRMRSQTVDNSIQSTRERHASNVPPRRPLLPPMQRDTASAPVRPRSTTRTDYDASSAVYQPMSASGFIHAPVPLPAGLQPVAPILDSRRSTTGSPMAMTPCFPEVEMRTPNSVHPYASAGAQAAPWVARPEPIQRPSMQRLERRPFEDTSSRRPLHHNATDQTSEAKPARSDDKENAGRGAQPGDACHSGGLGFGHSVPMAKEMGNVLFLQEAPNGYVGKKDRKGKPAPIDFHGQHVLQKRATFSVSPHPASPTTTSMSPSVGVGEVRGWFSNLFHWKVQTLVLYSVLDLPTTRTEVIRLLEGFGVAVATSEEGGAVPRSQHQWERGTNGNGRVLFCRADDGALGLAAQPQQKQVRFRVELSNGGLGAARGVGGGKGAVDHTQVHAQAQGPGYDTAIGIALDKGSVSTFKGLCQRLRTEWRLNALMSPESGVGAMPGIQQQFMV